MSYAVRLYREAIKVLDRMDRRTEERLRARLRELAANPFDPRLSKPLHGVEGLRASRVGDWRVLYTATETDQVIHVLTIRPRGRAYRRL